jgi:hypothetical protein
MLSKYNYQLMIYLNRFIYETPCTKVLLWANAAQDWDKFMAFIKVSYDEF